MSLPRMQPKDGVAWVTGASSGIGEAVSLELARRGWTVAITARRLDLLEDIARRAEGLPGRIVAHAGDVTETAAMQAVVDGIESVHGPIALAFLNAGIAPHVRSGAFDLVALEQAFPVNLFGVAKGLAAVLERMTPRGRGQIAVNASIAGYGGMPRGAAYGASKAAVIHLCEALKFDCDRLGIRLQLVNPGFVDTPLTRGNGYPMPLLMPLAEAARRIVDGFARGGFEIAFPRRLAWFAKAVNCLPYPAYFWLVARLTPRGKSTRRARN
ncbi:NAD(P)-dependent dehydrogenase (short-subunit alcohol dehydrogenase family) [Bosea sp. BE125]|uniref:SDR family NAD(P)-dependent oxidoreductase n=1 Tax=Bosea sp. BE125 TaxID=2817909 RepID=UPI00285948AA|nr:SDR family NAD(P)-dependent oxidoreductase [Bosea sp. BE125]MDR6870490.1 NAD(P)-dependent dehydrogenase (short-subunit alcohol dehydrogenase family) [Bosea sp. BE125]